MFGKDKSKTILKTSIIVVITTLFVAVVASMILFISLNSEMKLRKDLSTMFLEEGIIDADHQLVTMETQIENKLEAVQMILMITSILILVTVVVALTINLLMRYQTQTKTYQYAYIDEVTGLPTKAKHRLEIEKKIQNMHRAYAYVSVEIDNFNYIKELCGYEYGLYVIQYVAKHFKEMVEPDELLARTSEYRFGMLLQYESDEQLTRRLLDLFHACGQVPANDAVDSEYAITFTCGAYRITEVNESAIQIREKANIAREEAKKLFENNLEFYDEKLQHRRAEQEQYEYEMRQALDKQQFVVYMQPKYSVANEEIVGAEALVRWEHPDKGLLSPNSFVPLFESNGFIVKIDYYVLDSVCQFLRRWLDEGVVPIAISVNLSRVHLYNTDLVERLVEITDRYQIPHHLIEFELTETVLFEELSQLIHVMVKLKNAGFILSMDDFGSGYSSLNMLKQLPVDILKLDKAFLDHFDMGELGQREKTIVSHIISMAKALDMEVLAEGVENESQKEFLTSVDCDMIQGFYYAKPMKLERFDLEYRKMRSA